MFDIRSVQPSTVAVWKTLSSASDTIWWTYGEDCFLVPSSTSGEKDSKRWNVKLELCYWPWIVPPIVLYHCDGANINKNSTAFLFFKENQIGKSYYSIWSSDVFQDDWIIKQPYCFLQCKTSSWYITLWSIFAKQEVESLFNQASSSNYQFSGNTGYRRIFKIIVGWI